MSDSEDFSKITNAYNAAIELWKLASEQIYSRFSAMLIGNSIIIAITGLAITDRVGIPFCLLKWLVAGGWLLCTIWAFFVYQGVRVENHYRERTEHFEKMAIPNGEKVAISRSDKTFRGFRLATFFTIAVFVIIYAVLMTILVMRG